MNELNIERFTKALSEILSRKYEAKITITAIPKDSKEADASRLAVS